MFFNCLLFPVPTMFNWCSISKAVRSALILNTESAFPRQSHHTLWYATEVLICTSQSTQNIKSMCTQGMRFIKLITFTALLKMFFSKTKFFFFSSCKCLVVKNLTTSSIILDTTALIHTKTPAILPTIAFIPLYVNANKVVTG